MTVITLTDLSEQGTPAHFELLHSFKGVFVFVHQGSTLDADQLTDDEYRGTIRSRLKGFVRFDARYLLPFFSRKMTRQVSMTSNFLDINNNDETKSRKSV